MKTNIPLLAAAALIGVAFSTQTINAQEAMATHWSIDSNGHPSGIGGGGFNFNNGPIIGDWDNFADFGSLIFHADFNNGSFDDTNLLAGAGQIQPWGPVSDSDTATYGETFTDPDGATSLNDFTFFIDDNGDGANFQYQAFVMTWTGPLISDGSSIDESGQQLLYASNLITYVGNGSVETVEVSIPGGLALTPGANYEIGFSTLGTSVLVPVGPGTGSGVPDASSTALLLTVACGGLAAVRRRFGRA